MGTKTMTAPYSGDTNYAQSSATAITVTVTSQGSFTMSGTAVTATAGASGTSTITVTPTGGVPGDGNAARPAPGGPAGRTRFTNPQADQGVATTRRYKHTDSGRSATTA